MSGYIGDAITRKGIQAQEVGFLQKPFAPTVLARKYGKYWTALP